MVPRMTHNFDLNFIAIGLRAIRAIGGKKIRSTRKSHQDGHYLPSLFTTTFSLTDVTLYAVAICSHYGYTIAISEFCDRRPNNIFN